MALFVYCEEEKNIYSIDFIYVQFSQKYIMFVFKHLKLIEKERRRRKHTTHLHVNAL